MKKRIYIYIHIKCWYHHFFDLPSGWQCQHSDVRSGGEEKRPSSSISFHSTCSCWRKGKQRSNSHLQWVPINENSSRHNTTSPWLINSFKCLFNPSHEHITPIGYRLWNILLCSGRMHFWAFLWGPITSTLSNANDSQRNSTHRTGTLISTSFSDLSISLNVLAGIYIYIYLFSISFANRFEPLQSR